MISACDSVWGACVLAINSYVMHSTATSTRITVHRERRSSGAYPQIRWEAPLLLLLLLLLPLTYSKQTTWFPLRKQKEREGGRERERGWEREIEGERERKRARERIGVGLGAASSLRRQQADLSEGERITSVDLICQFFFSQSSTTEPSPNPPSTTHHLHSAVQKR